MKIKIVNPVSLNEQRKTIERCITLIKKFKDPETEVVWVNVKEGPPEIKQCYDEAFVLIYAVEEMIKAEAEGFNAVFMPCFGDIGIDAAKEALKIPVVGACEASVHVASMVGRRFSIITPTRQSIRITEDLVYKYRMSHKLASVECVDISPIEFACEKGRKRLKKALLEKTKNILQEGLADTIILGCGGMTGLGLWLQRKLNIPVIEPLLAGIKMAETLVKLQLSQSKRAYISPTEIGV